MNAPLDAAIWSCELAQIAGAIRYLRVAQREHYIAGSVSRFALRWWTSSPLNLALLLCGVAGVVLADLWHAAGCATAVVCLAGPIGLTLRGRTSKLSWTRRLRVLALVSLLIAAAADLGGAAVSGTFGGPGPAGALAGRAGHLAGAVRGAARHPGAAVVVAALVALVVPVVIDVALALTAPFERIAARRFVRAASAKLSRIGPRVVAITGSYGKTSTKNYVAHLIAGRYSVVASPASFNNTAGLARAVNENLNLGTEVFVAEMGTYGPGEIAAMCDWLTPEVSVITAIGPVHLERMRSEERILEAKAEICERARVVVLNVDDRRLAALADRLEADGREVRRAAAASMPDVALPRGVAPTNAACAVEVARALGVDEAEIGGRLASLPPVANRRTTYQSEKGFTVVDDTYNSNPAGCRAALADLTSISAPSARRVVVTPGMVELGSRQARENESFAAEAVGRGATVVAVGRTNRRALATGARAAGGSVITMATRSQAVAWVRSQLGPGDAVLYENDLPDHFP